MTKTLYALAILLIVGGLAYHFAALAIFNALVPKDAGSKLVARDLAYGSDPRQMLDLYAPTGGAGPWPVIVFVHGGSWQSGSKDGYAFVGRALAAQGFVVAVMSYRLHPAHTYPAFVEDVATALQWTAKNIETYDGRADQLFALGHSAGAYNLAMAILDTRYAAITPDVAGVATLAGPFDFVPLDSPITIEVFGHLADLPPTQPINHVRGDAPPFLILHGSADTTVRIKNAKSLLAAFDRARAKAEMKIYDGVSHVGILLALSKPLRGKTPVLDDTIRFFRDKLK